MRTTLSLVLLSSLALAAAPAPEAVTVTVAPFEKDRRWVLVEYDAKGKTLPGDFIVDEKGAGIEGQNTPRGIAWLVPFIPAGQKLRFTIEKSRPRPAPALRWSNAEGAISSLKFVDKEITRYNTGAAAEKQKHHKPFFWPLNARGVN